MHFRPRNALFAALLTLSCFFAAPLFSGETAPPYENAIREEEAVLRAMRDDPPEPRGTWGASEVLGLTALLAAIAAMLWAANWIRRMPLTKRTGGEMRILDVMRIGRQSSLLVVRMRGKDYWLSESPGGITLLKEFPESEDEMIVKSGHGQKNINPE